MRFEVYESQTDDMSPSLAVNVFFSDVVDSHEPGAAEKVVRFNFRRYVHAPGDVSYANGVLDTKFGLDNSDRQLLEDTLKLMNRLARVKGVVYLSDYANFLSALKRIGYKPCAYNPHTQRYHDLNHWPNLACWSAESLGTEIRVFAEDRQEARTLIREEWEARLAQVAPPHRIHGHYAQWDGAGRPIREHGIYPLYVAPQLAEAGFKVPHQMALAV